MRIRPLCLLLLFVLAGNPLSFSHAQELPWSQRMANTAIKRWPNGKFVSGNQPWKWNYELGVLLQGMDDVWYHTGDATYYRYMKNSVDTLVGSDGSIPTYRPEDNELDDLALGRTLLVLYGVTQDAKYYKAATLLRDQLRTHPRTSDGGFWHKQRYPNQMWLDGLYMAEPFYADYAVTFHQPQDFEDITKQFVLMEEHARDPKTGLLYHGWNETRQQRWANKDTGASPSFWARGMGWYMMALVDTLPYYQENDPGRAKLLAILQRLAAAITKYQDKNTGLWYQVVDKPHEKGNYLESSAACMFTYAMAKGVRLGYLQPSYLQNAEHAWQGIRKQFVKTEPNGEVTLTGTVHAIGLGAGIGNDGSFNYYTTQEVVSNDPKGVGAFLMAATEIESAQTAKLGRGKTVLLDAWYNSQTRKNAAGQMVLYHYKWDDYANSGYSIFGHMLREYGLKTDTLTKAPSLADLNKAQIYLIASPDNPQWNKSPHYMNEDDAAVIADWVRGGGMLVIMQNDPTHADIEHMNVLADKFGMHFNNVQLNAEVGNHFEMARIDVPGNGPVFRLPHVLFMKEICTISPTAPSVPVWTWKNNVLMAKARYGKGIVVGLVDPWLYNEYTDGRKLPPPYDNFAGGKEYILWLLKQLPKH
ncbi:glycoside hydrolase family 88 protein [Pseudacidobacterium ailaaui]|jgi:unsaturated rhamnogalacturonyl hydrolase|uniref:glycoside hydrolase family 88 protein n=1 Tax=Pseudacidobacterium ailaaui TaxID=1382359 RepID=UPI00047D5E34|nr:glycoside hydrolase family 88 protein [Pseudacidobacterium ailaaui]MBX6358840.1 glycoside hydrolase family 88 protein [Pseudacidobacterium ailaaui]